ncbi:class I heat shock protein, putative (DUF1423) [Tasmannia lanceolata]|uniref:class I heat shock protein, putative (DUF1423) n=1 Tax=Tasmannia lanceolata TaxID=3420 RepID=UPI004062820B
MFRQNDLSKGLTNGAENLQNKLKKCISIPDLENPDQKSVFSEPGGVFLKESEMGDGGFCVKQSKFGLTKEKMGNLGSQELTLSYLCDTSKMGFLEREISGKNLLSALEKGGYNKGKEVILDSVENDERWVERDFMQLSGNSGSKREIDEEIEGGKREKKAKIETLNLSLALPDVSLSLTPSNPLPNLDPPNSPKRNYSTQSIIPSNNNTRANSDDFTASISYSYSHPFSHNPSCSLMRNSTENYEYSVGSRRRESDQIWYCGEGTNGSVHSKFKPIGDSVTFSNHSGHPLMQSLNPNKDSSNNLYRTNSSENQSFFPSELPARTRKDNHITNSRGRASEQRKIADNGLANSDGAMPLSRNERILGEIVSESIPVMAQILNEIHNDSLEAAKECLKNLMTVHEKREEFASLQRRLDKRSDLTFETLLKCHKVQLDILVAVKTGIAEYLSIKNRIPMTELIEILLLSRCKNMNCKSSLPVDDCDCKICSTKKGFCSACMCLVCSNFDCASNTCSWVGCDVCSHWCHAICGIQRHLIKPGTSSKGAAGTTEMRFHCLGCGHASELFGFVKEVFMCCATDWGLETLVKELDCVRKIFQGSVDAKGKELHKKAEEMLTELEKKHISSSEACSGILKFFKYAGSGLGSSSKDLGQVSQRGDVPLLPPTPIPLNFPYNISHRSSARTEVQRNTHQNNMEALMSQQTIEPELKFGMPKKDEFDSLESIVRIKEAEARMFQSRADEARREAEGFRQLVRARSEKLEEEYASKLAKLCLQETEERRREKLEELKVLENSQCDYFKMKMRMKAEIAGLLERMEATKQQWV